MIIWIRHSSFLIQGEKQIYIDPCGLKKGVPAANIILITHFHENHFSLNDIEQITNPQTQIVCNETTASQLGKFANQAKIVKPEEKINISEIEIESFPAYNIEENYHKRDAGGLGFIFTVSGKKIYHAGDTDVIPEMFNIRNCDIALLPVSGTSVMNADEAARAAMIIKPALAIPMHYGFSSGTIEDANRFCYLSTKRGIPAKLLTPQ